MQPRTRKLGSVRLSNGAAMLDPWLVGLSTAVVLAGCSVPPSPAIVVTGTVSLGPICPVETIGTPCATSAQGFSDTQVSARNGATEITVPVSAAGDFALTLNDGTWLVTSNAGMSCTTVTVSRSGPVAIDCDTGIR